MTRPTPSHGRILVQSDSQVSREPHGQLHVVIQPPAWNVMGIKPNPLSVSEAHEVIRVEENRQVVGHLVASDHEISLEGGARR